MKYTNYISAIVKSQGTPNLSNEGFAMLMNIVHVEGAKMSLEKLKEKESNPALKFKYDIFIEDYKTKLDALTGGMESKELFRAINKMG
jgi:hypothetical protein